MYSKIVQKYFYIPYTRRNINEGQKFFILHLDLQFIFRIFEPIPLRINNLGDDASRHDGSDYKPTPVRKSARLPDGFTELIESLK